MDTTMSMPLALVTVSLSTNCGLAMPTMNNATASQRSPPSTREATEAFRLATLFTSCTDE